MQHMIAKTPYKMESITALLIIGKVLENINMIFQSGIISRKMIPSTSIHLFRLDTRWGHRRRKPIDAKPKNK